MHEWASALPEPILLCRRLFLPFLIIIKTEVKQI
jgi:hypothetical protein